MELDPVRPRQRAIVQVKDKQMVLPVATKDSLKALPEFKYNTGS
jgi:hypothetical protein